MKAKKLESSDEIKILMRENSHVAENIISTLEAALPQIEKISLAFQDMGIGNITDEYLADILLNNGSETKEAAFVVLSKQPKAYSRVQENSLTRIFTETIEETMSEIQGILNGNGFISESTGFQGDLSTVADKIVKYITIGESGKPELTDQSIEQIREDSRLYIRTDKGKTLYEKHCKAIEALNDLSGIVCSLPKLSTNTFGILNIFTPGSLNNQFEIPVIDYDAFMCR